MASSEGSSESPTHKTWVLKVSVHCQGCKKKVLKILKNMPGVHEAEVDVRQNKVTVKADCDAETLIRRLEKSGKHAELWPEKKPTNQTTNNGDASGKKEGKETPKPKEPVADSDTTPSAPKPSEAAKLEAKPKPQAEPFKIDSKTAEITTEKQLPTSESKKADGAKKEPEKPAAADADNKETASASREAAASDGSGKKKGKKAQKQSSEAADNNFPAESTNSPPPEHLHNHPQHPPLPPPPAYVMSYNVAQSSASQSYYAPPASQGYLQTPYPYPYPPPPEFYGGPSYYDTPAWMQQQQPPPNDNMFSDENPNACNLM